jgi:hypothetical protein
MGKREKSVNTGPKSYKFRKYDRLKPITSESSDKLEKSQVCNCGSGKTFGECCYRQAHPKFDVNAYLERLKDHKLMIHDRIFVEICKKYFEGTTELRTWIDSQVQAFDFEDLEEILSPYEEEFDPDQEFIFRLSLVVEKLGIDSIFPDQTTTIIQKLTPVLKVKANEIRQEIIESYAKSEIAIYEVVSVRYQPGTDIPGSYLLKELCTGEIFEFKDTSIADRIGLWDYLIGRRYRADGFVLFSTSMITLKPHQKAVFNRLLIYFWLRAEFNSKVNSPTAKSAEVLVDLKKIHPDLFEYFPHIDFNMELPALYNAAFKNFIKTHSEILYTIIKLTSIYSEKLKPEIYSPDGNRLEFCETEAKLVEENRLNLIKHILCDPSVFHCESDAPLTTQNSEMVKFGFYLPAVELPERKAIANAQKMVPLEEALLMAKDEFAHCLFERSIKKLLFQAESITTIEAINLRTNKISTQVSSEDKENVVRHLIQGERVRLGSVEIENNIFRLNTFSQQSMHRLLKTFEPIIDRFDLRFSPVDISSMEDDVEDADLFEEDEEDEEEFEERWEAENSISDAIINNSPFLISHSSYSSTILHQNLHRQSQPQVQSSYGSNYSDLRNNAALDQDLLRRMTYEWLKTPLPALNGLTPQQGLNDQKFRPYVIQLMKEHEAEWVQKDYPLKEIRKILHLDKILGLSFTQEKRS